MRKVQCFWYGTLIILAAIVVSSGILLALRAEARRPYAVPILMYHEVGDVTNSPWLSVPLETFRSQMTSLRAQGYKAILPSDISAHRKWGKPLPRKPVIITFDDGFLSNLTLIEPVLKTNGLRAVIYLVTGQTAETAADRCSHEGWQCLVWPEILAMQKRGTFVFGGHAHTHKNLAGDVNPLNLAGDANPLLQTSECRHQLLLHGIRKPDAFCYPYGLYNQATIKAVRQAGFQTAVTCKDAVALIGPTTDLFTLSRVFVMGGSHEFKLLDKRVADSEQTLICRVFYKGLSIPREISACLRGSGNEKDLWVTREVPPGEFDLRFVLPNDGGGHKRNLVEIWDKHRLFKLAELSL